MTSRTSRVARIATALAAVSGLVIMGASPASAHAIVELNGDPAYAGRTSVMTLEMQHGCLSNELGIDKVVATFNKKFGTVKPKSVAGWKSKVRSTSGNKQRIVWTLTGSVPAFNQPTYFPIKISWPKQPGVYGVPVAQVCDGEVNRWDVPDGPATADKPSPPLYPLPQIEVLAEP
jgi:hypothetical protein